VKLIPKYFFLNSSGDSLGPPHFKVRLFKSELLNSEELTKNKSYGFLIESSKVQVKGAQKTLWCLQRKKRLNKIFPEV
jgi:hypothetical protein